MNMKKLEYLLLCLMVLSFIFFNVGLVVTLYYLYLDIKNQMKLNQFILLQIEKIEMKIKQMSYNETVWNWNTF